MAWKAFVNSLTAGASHSDPRFGGVKISLIGFLIALAGFVILALDFSAIGKLAIYVGIAVGFVGIVWSIILILRQAK